MNNKKISPILGALLLLVMSVIALFTGQGINMIRDIKYEGATELSQERAIELIQKYDIEGNFSSISSEDAILVYDFHSSDKIDDLENHGKDGFLSGVLLLILCGGFLIFIIWYFVHNELIWE